MQSLWQKLDSLGVSVSGGTKVHSSVHSSLAHSSLAHSSLASPKRRSRLLPVVAIALLCLVGSWWIHRSVHRAKQQITTQSLHAILSANVAVLQNWLGAQQASVASAAANKSIQESANVLIAKSEVDFDWDADDLLGLPEFDKLSEELQLDKFLGWSIINDNNVVIASNIDRLIGQALPIPDPTRQMVMAREPTVLMPIESPVAITADGPLSMAKCPIMGVMAPILEDNQFHGSLVLLINPLDRFSELMSIASDGDGGETYAFDRTGILLTRSRHEDQLRDAGLLSEDPRVVSPLNIAIRDPGVNVADGNRPSNLISEQRLTVMADLATRGGSGYQVDGYNDYRGVPVVGAWTWLPEHEIGVASEIDLATAEAPFRSLRRSYFTLMAILALSVLALLFFVGKEGPGNQRMGFRQSGSTSHGRRFGRYELGEILGRGGMGSVYRGKHEVLRRPVAIKVLAREDISVDSGIDSTEATPSGARTTMSPDAITRFEREVQLTASLRHPNTIDVYDYGRADDGTFFYVMEFIDGITLQQLIDDFGAQPPARVIHLLLQICGSLREAHLCGLVHRDVKPANILLTSEAGVVDWIKVLDFGLIKSVETTTQDQSLTQSDSVTGTPMYMSPECVRDASESDALSDLYSLGAVGYALLTGKPIFEGTGSVDICMKQLKEEPIRPEKRLNFPLPDDLQNVLMSCLRKSPSDRPQGIDELASALRACDDALAWTDTDAIQWWEVVYTEKNASQAAAGGAAVTAAASPNHDTLDNEA